MLLVIYFTDYDYLFPIHKWEFENQSILNHYSIKVMYVVDKKSKIELIGKDKLKFNNMKSFTTFFEKTFPIVNWKSIKFDKFNFCGLPKSSNTSHCFADSTHRTCCLLGKDARKYANESGNPIGKASEEAFFMEYFLSYFLATLNVLVAVLLDCDLLLTVTATIYNVPDSNEPVVTSMLLIEELTCFESKMELSLSFLVVYSKRTPPVGNFEVILTLKL